MNEFNLNDGFKNYIVAKIFYAPTKEKKGMEEKKKYIYIYIYTHTIQYINSSCYTIPKLTPKKKTFTKNCHIIEI